ncbi:MAG: SMC-Scp complex subunit ScpB [bacterium]|nr:SMC-Scp complex subunit ScpB [bacterium]
MTEMTRGGGGVRARVGDTAHESSRSTISTGLSDAAKGNVYPPRRDLLSLPPDPAELVGSTRKNGWLLFFLVFLARSLPLMPEGRSQRKRPAQLFLTAPKLARGTGAEYDGPAMNDPTNLVDSDADASCEEEKVRSVNTPTTEPDSETTAQPDTPEDTVADAGSAAELEAPDLDSPDEQDMAGEDESSASPTVADDPHGEPDASTGESEIPGPEVTVESVVEALLLATDAPLPASKIAQLVGVGDARDVKRHISSLNDHYEQSGRCFRIESIAKGYQILTLPAYNGWVGKLLKVRDETKLSPAAMETLAIVAYRQPVLRADVEAIRGVACGEMLNRLREMNLAKIVGRAEEPGRPMLYGTTNHFLKVFGLGALSDLPSLDSLPVPPPNPQSE